MVSRRLVSVTAGEANGLTTSAPLRELVRLGGDADLGSVTMGRAVQVVGLMGRNPIVIGSISSALKPSMIRGLGDLLWLRLWRLRSLAISKEAWSFMGWRKALSGEWWSSDFSGLLLNTWMSGTAPTITIGLRLEVSSTEDTWPSCLLSSGLCLSLGDLDWDLLTWGEWSRSSSSSSLIPLNITGLGQGLGTGSTVRPPAGNSNVTFACLGVFV